jgi:predicted TIM-barrel fold metal-dependent hydrolase
MLPIVDLHCHLMSARPTAEEDFRRLAASPEVHRVAVCALDLKIPLKDDAYATVPRCQSTNEDLVKLISHIGSPKLVPWCYIDPREPDAADQVAYWIGERKMRGIKMFPPIGWYPDEPRVIPAFKAAEKFNVPVLLHMGRVAVHPALRSKYGRPVCLEEVGLACPRLKILIGHFANMWRWEAFHISQGFPNFFFDLATSGTIDLDLLRLVITHTPRTGLQRLVLGTDGNGENNLRLAKETLNKLRVAGFSETELDAIGHYNGLAVLGEPSVER